VPRILLVPLLLVQCCTRPPLPCAGPDTCDNRQLCIAGRCAAPGSEPAPRESQRIVVAPTDLAVVTARGESSALPRSVPFGRQERGSVVLLLRFPTPWGNKARIAGAFLLLWPVREAPAESRPVPIAVARILEPWVGTEVSWGRLPRLSPAELSTVATSTSSRPLRIDVTEIVKRWTRSQPDDQGIALVASAIGPDGTSYATGLGGGLAPRLDVYVR